MDIDLDGDLSTQLKDCEPGEKITLMGTVTANDAGTVSVTIDTATSDKYEEEGETGNGTTAGQAGMPMAPEEQPSLPGPVKMLLKRR